MPAKLCVGKLVLSSIPLGGMFCGRDADVSKVIQDKTVRDACREGVDQR